MARDDAPPFERGTTLFAGLTPDGESYEHILGQVWEFEDNTHIDGAKVRCMAVRNDSGAALEGKRLAAFKTGYYGRRLAGYATLTSQQNVYPIDDQLTSCPDDDICYVVVRGPCLVKSSLAGDGENVIAAEAPLTALTGATTGATTAGRVVAIGTSNATFNLGIFGVALSAATTANTNSDVLAFIHGKF